MAGHDDRFEKIEIICPCGLSFDAYMQDEGGEYPCPKCGRVNVLVENKGQNAGEGKGGKGTTTVRTALQVPQVKLGDTLGPYKITGFVGEGGMGRVFAAEDTSLQRPAAVKILSQQLLNKKDFVARFEREARAIARLNNPNIVQIYYTGVENGIPYYAMEMVSGGSLDTLKGSDRLLPDRAVSLLLQAAQGLVAASAEGVIHRDIKPSNLMLDRAGRLKITDFGLAKTVAIDSALTHTGTIIGTPYYMSPEQGEGLRLDERADIYSLGATFYHLLAGSPPFEADSPIGVILKHINEPLPPLRSKNKGVPIPLARVIEKMMVKEPGKRYASYQPLIADLKAIQSGLGLPREEQPDTWIPREPGGERKSSFVIVDEEAPDQPEAIRLVRCGLLRRFLAQALDYSTLYLLYYLYAKSYRIAQQEHLTADELIQADQLYSALFLIISFFYFFFGDARGGMTLGKTLFRCRVGNKHGENIGFRKSFFRTLLFFPSLFSLGVLNLIEPWNEFLQAYYNAGFESYFDRVDLVPGGRLYPFMQICFVWLFVNLGFFLVTLGRSALHDLFSGSIVYAIGRRKKTKVKKKKAKKTQTVASRMEPETETGINSDPGRNRPPPIPRDADQSRQNYPPFMEARGPKNPRLAMMLSIIPGLGQLYNGDLVKGILILLTCWLVFPWILGIIDAYFKARLINRQASLPRPPDRKS